FLFGFGALGVHEPAERVYGVHRKLTRSRAYLSTAGIPRVIAVGRIDRELPDLAVLLTGIEAEDARYRAAVLRRDAGFTRNLVRKLALRVDDTTAVYHDAFLGYEPGR